MNEEQTKKAKSNLRKKADEIKKFRCKNLIAVLEEPENPKNIGTVIRNINALGVEKLYIVDSKNLVPDEWEEMRQNKFLMKTSVSGVKWSFVKKFKSTEDCFNHLESKGFISYVTSPHMKGKKNIILHEGNYQQSKVAVWFGNESHGISDLALKRCDACINIEMFGIIESFNLGTSSGIVMYEITKQRREYQKVLYAMRKANKEKRKEQSKQK